MATRNALAKSAAPAGTSVFSGPEGAYLEKAIGRFSPEVARTAKTALAKLRRRFPGANLTVYDRPRNLPIGFAPAIGGSALFSVVLYQSWVRFFFLEGVHLPDPQGKLEGSGNQVRSIKLDKEASMLDDPYIGSLIDLAARDAKVDLVSGPGAVVLKSTR